ncbi:hypothetical protein GCM10023317_85380 [Actinopolymorpha pittospori]|uniref:Uncharacterized protein n=1 Tax=Actinopolymorpha pittospori TaxID=648752 RepID=A0A927MVE5_9ACTN|nr:hypothetical protein [Actinopolymorpha pittospori]
MEQAAQLLADLWIVLHAYGAFDGCMADVANVPKWAVLTTQAVRRHDRALAAVADPATYNPFVISGPLAHPAVGQTRSRPRNRQGMGKLNGIDDATFRDQCSSFSAFPPLRHLSSVAWLGS